MIEYSSNFNDIYFIDFIQSSDIETILDLNRKAFGKILDPYHADSWLKRSVDWDMSYKVVHNNKIVGFYLLKPNDINDYFNVLEAKYLEGIEGISFYIEPQHRGKGIGKKLKELTKLLGYDYIWGGHDKRLNNIDHWLKTRKMVDTTEDAYYTIEIYGKTSIKEIYSI